MIPCDSEDIIKEYNILLNELKEFNEELLDKPRVLAITKCDMIDEGMQEEMKAFLPKGIPTIFISAVAQKNLVPLKDMLWEIIAEDIKKGEEW